VAFEKKLLIKLIDALEKSRIVFGFHRLLLFRTL
jgi:hypothetical protein